MKKLVTPKFSVLICVYQGDKDTYFDLALQSITLAQTLKPNQIVLVVDGPVSYEKNSIIAKYEQEYDCIDVLRLERNVGLVNALNEGLKRCKYDYVARMDSDDISTNERFEVQMNYLAKNSHIDVLSCYVREFNNNGLKMVRALPLRMSEIIRFSKFRSPINHGACIYKKSTVMRAGAYVEYSQLQDYELFVKLIVSGAVLENIPDILVMVRMDEGYNKKSGFVYFKEECSLALRFYKFDHIGWLGLIRNIIFRATPRLLPKFYINLIYKIFLR